MIDTHDQKTNKSNLDTESGIIDKNNHNFVVVAKESIDDPQLYKQYGLPLQSPGSYMASSIQSHQMSSFEVDASSVASTGGTASWRPGMPWIRNPSSKRQPNLPPNLRHSSSPLPLEMYKIGNQQQTEARYYGGIMAVEQGPPPTREISPRSRMAALSNPLKFVRNNISQLTRSSHGNDSIDDFHESEWTPQDSAYGAACPVCGCIPKQVRRLIEFTLIAAMVFCLVYVVVTTSMRITNDRMEAANKTTTTDYYGGQIALDDDLYVASYKTYLDDNPAYYTYGDDKYYMDDDYSNNAANDDVNNNNDDVVDDGDAR